MCTPALMQSFAKVGATQSPGARGGSVLASMGIGALGEAGTAMFGAKSEKYGLNLEAKFADMAAEQEANNARYALEAAQKTEQTYALSAAQLKSTQRAGLAASGVDLGAGSALAEQVSTDYVTETDRNQIRLNAQREAAGYRTKATSDRITALTKRAGAKAISPLMSGVSSLAGSASKIAGKWYTLNKLGAFEKDGATGGSVTGNPIGRRISTTRPGNYGR